MATTTATAYGHTITVSELEPTSGWIAGGDSARRADRVWLRLSRDAPERAGSPGEIQTDALAGRYA